MKVLLVGIYDARSVSLAPWVLKSYASQFVDDTIVTREYSLFQSEEDIIKDINEVDADIVGFSVYIWNINEILGMAPYISAKIILGGPQVTDIEEDILIDNPKIDAIVTGEGEEALVKMLKCQNFYSDIDGVTTRSSHNAPNGNVALDSIPYFYDELFSAHKDIEWITIETSRGCPYGCRYCAWGKRQKMKYLPLDRVKKNIDSILSNDNIKYIYFADSCLILNKKRAKEILKYLGDKGTDKIIKYEFHYDHFDEEIIDLLSRLPHNEFSFGVQTANEECAKIVNRQFDKPRFEAAIDMVSHKLTGQHVTVDLIYGLPGDDIEGYKGSLDYVFGLNNVEKINTYPFIVLPGSDIFRNRDLYDMKHDKETYVIQSTSSFPKNDIELAKIYSFYMFIIGLNYSVKNTIKMMADDRGERYIDVIIDFFDSLPVHFNAPHLGHFNKDSLSEKKQSINHVISEYDLIVDGLKKFSNSKYDSMLEDYNGDYSIYYYRYKQLEKNI